ncbi:MAG: MBL fold metallo-hydrolase [Pseudomonadota bacterium]
MRRIFFALIVLALLGFLAFNTFKIQIAERAFLRAVDQNVGVDPSEELPDGLHVYICGSGSPMPDATRAGPCLGILAGRRGFVFDVGSGGARNLGAMGFPMANIETVYLTHLHSDHIDGLGELLLMSWINASRTEPTPVRGPAGTIEVVTGFNTAYRLDSTYRLAHHGIEVANPAGYGGAPEEITIPQGPGGQSVVFEDTDLKITAIRVGHAPIEPAFGYRVDYKGRSLTLSGDTIYHPGFVAASQGADLMLHEALNKKMVQAIGAKMAEVGIENGRRIFHDILDYHTDPEEAAQAAQEAGVDQLVFYHIVPQLPVKLLEGVFVGDSKKIFDGKITVGQDGMIFSLPAGTDEIRRSRGF